MSEIMYSLSGENIAKSKKVQILNFGSSLASSHLWFYVHSIARQSILWEIILWLLFWLLTLSDIIFQISVAYWFYFIFAFCYSVYNRSPRFPLYLLLKLSLLGVHLILLLKATRLFLTSALFLACLLVCYSIYFFINSCYVQDSLALAVADEMQKVYKEKLGPEPVPLTVLRESIDEENVSIYLFLVYCLVSKIFDIIIFLLVNLNILVES